MKSKRPRFVYIEISEDEARRLVAAGDPVFVHPFKPMRMERFIPNSKPVQIQESESGARLQPEMYFKMAQVAQTNGRKVKKK